MLKMVMLRMDISTSSFTKLFLETEIVILCKNFKCVL